MNKNLLSVKDVQEILGISRDRAYRLFRDKSFPSFKIEDRWAVFGSAFERWIELSQQMSSSKTSNVCQKFVCQEFGGWSNYFTHSAFLWICGDEYCTQEMVEEVLNDENICFPQRALADRLKAYVEDNRPVTAIPLYHELLSDALDAVDYNQIAEALLENYNGGGV